MKNAIICHGTMPLLVLDRPSAYPYVDPNAPTPITPFERAIGMLAGGKVGARTGRIAGFSDDSCPLGTVAASSPHGPALQFLVTQALRRPLEARNEK